MIQSAQVASHTIFSCNKCGARLFSGDDLLGETTTQYLFGAPLSQEVVSLHKHYDEEGEHTGVQCVSCSTPIGSASTQSVYNDDSVGAAQTNFRILKASVRTKGMAMRSALPLGALASLFLVLAVAGGAYFLYTQKREASAQSYVETRVVISDDELVVLVRDARFATRIEPEAPTASVEATLYLLNGSVEVADVSTDYDYIVLGPNRDVRIVYEADFTTRSFTTEATDSYLLILPSDVVLTQPISLGTVMYFVSPGDLLSL